MGWDKAAQERLEDVVSSRAYYEIAVDDIRAALDEIKRLGEEEKAVDLYRKHFLRLTDWMGDRSGKVWRSGHDISERVIVRAESAEREAQQQQERADRLEAALLDRRQGYDAPVPGLAEARQRIATLEAALTQAHLALQGAWALLPPEDGERLGIKRLMLECERPECAALAAQPAPESQHGNVTEPCGCDCGCGVRVPACWATLLCPDCAREECPQGAEHDEIKRLEAALDEINEAARLGRIDDDSQHDALLSIERIECAALAAQPANPQEGRTERLVRQAIQHLHDGYIGAAIACLRGVLGEDASTPVAAQPAQEGR